MITIALGVTVVLLLVAIGFAIYYRRKVKSWGLVFAGLSNAERILLMWPSIHGRPVKVLSFSVDRDAEDGYARLHAGPTLMAKFPIQQAIDGQKTLKELVDSTK